jgi:integrase
MATELLRRRQASAAEECARRGFDAKSRGFVFPARSKQSKSGHYSDATALLDALRDEAGIEKLTRHDLRRSFGAMMTTMDVPEGVRKRFFNHSDASVTDTYTRAEWAMLREWMTRIEQEILAKAPNVYNALKPVDWPMLAAPEPHVSRLSKPRPGRPKKFALTG